MKTNKFISALILTIQLFLPYFTNANQSIELFRLGTDYGGWTIPQKLLIADSICYCVGAGEDISFDIELIKNFGCNVYVFDPTPKAIDHIVYIREKISSGQTAYINNKPTDTYDLTPTDLNNLFFFPIGLWDSDITIKFFAPANPQHASYSGVNLQDTDLFVEATCKKLSTIMQELQHTQLDLLKLDVEGAEYQVIQNMLEENIFPTIFCVEFHKTENFDLQKTIDSLLNHGYYLLHQHKDTDFTFVLNAAIT